MPVEYTEDEDGTPVMRIEVSGLSFLPLALYGARNRIDPLIKQLEEGYVDQIDILEKLIEAQEFLHEGIEMWEEENTT